MEMIRLLLNS